LTPVLCPKCTDFLQLRPLLLVLLALLSASTPAHGRVIKPGLKPENIFKQASSGCLTQKDSKFPQIVRVNISTSSTSQDTKASADVSRRSLAPWDYRIDEDHDRFPRLIADAECRPWCVDAEGQPDHSVNAAPIKQEILVLRREQRGCQQSYRLEKRIITVGCTCVIPLTQHQA
ncbi:IL17F protein, partial [Notiomystis cincta]|nr:IL17F protein [Notiomystis cincta]